MINDFTGGGQIFLHKLRMFFQVLNRSFKTAFLVSISIVAVFSYKAAMSDLDLKAAFSYQKAFVANHIDNATSGMRATVSKNPDTYYTKINIHDKKGLVARDEDPRRVLKSRFFRGEFSKVVEFVKIRLIIAAGLMCGIFIMIYFTWSKFGKAAKEKKHLSGHIVKTAKEVAQTLKRKNMASYFHLGDLPLVKDSETKHILITGSTGSGKTNCLHTLLPQIRVRKQPAIVVDTEGEMIARYYRPGYDILLNPFDSRAYRWSLWDEIDSSAGIDRIADSIFPDSSPDSYKGDEKWNEWGKMLFIGVLEHMRAKGEPTVEELYNLIHMEPIESLVEKLKSTSVGTLLGNGESKGNNAAPHNIRINAMLATKWLKFLNDEESQRFSFRKWFANLDSSKDDRWVFIASSGGDTKMLLPFISSLADIAISSLVALGVKEDRRVWFIFDELAKLKYLPTLQENVTILRKYGGCVLAATQSINQLFAHYGRNSGSTMLSQFNTNVIFRITEVKEAKTMAERIGEIEYLSHQKNTSYGAHEFRDGISYTEQEKKQDVIKVNDLNSLKPNQAFVLLPEPDVAISKVSLEIVKKPENLQPSFLKNPSVEPNIQDGKKEESSENIRQTESNFAELAQKHQGPVKRWDSID